LENANEKCVNYVDFSFHVKPYEVM